MIHGAAEQLDDLVQVCRQKLAIYLPVNLTVKLESFFEHERCVSLLTVVKWRKHGSER